MIDPEIQSYIQQQIASAQTGALFSTTNAAAHTHNGIDSPKIAQNLLPAGVSSVTASGPGITATPTTGAVVVANTGVTSLAAGTGISLSNTTGAIRVTATGGGGGTWNNGTATRAFNAASGSQAIPHYMFVTPTHVRITAMYVNGGPELGQSVGAYTASSGAYNCVSTCIEVGQSPIGGTGNYVVLLYDVAFNSNSAVVASIDSTYINLTWVHTGSGGSQTMLMLWEAWA